MAGNAGKGRPKGRRNRRTLMAKRELEEIGFDPLIKMVEVFQEAEKRYKDAAEVKDLENAGIFLKQMGEQAGKLMKYTYPQLKSVEVTGQGGGPVQFENISLKEALQVLRDDPFFEKKDVTPQEIEAKEADVVEQSKEAQVDPLTGKPVDDK